MGGGRATLTKAIFFGTPEYVLPVLEALHKYYKVVAVVTQPPKLVGRKQIPNFSAVDKWAYKRKIPIIRDIKEEPLPEANLGVVASYGNMIPERIINHFSSGILNIHPSLLPKYRGASPIQSQIIDGLTETGVTVIKMDKLMDHGAIVSSLRDVIEPDDTNETLRTRLFERSAQFLIELLPNYLSNRIKPKEQNHDEATFTKLVNKEDGFVDLKKMDAQEIDRRMRAYNPWPGIWTYVDLDGRQLRLKILAGHIFDENKFIPDKVQLEGKKSVDFDEFKRGYPQIEI